VLVNATGRSYDPHKVQEHLIQSSVVAQVFKITVLQPISRTDNSERFPVLYVTDSDDYFGGCASLANHLQLSGETPRFILVGIGYEDTRAARLLRMRDFFTHAIRKHFQSVIDQVAQSPLVSGVDDLKEITQSTDARDFLHFIREELIPFISARYPALPEDNNYYGYSAGGGFGLYTLFTQPDTFRRYILGSPTTSYDGHHFGIALAKAFISADRALDAKVFISVGELEEFIGQFDLVTGYYLLSRFLKTSAVPGLDLSVRLFPGENHATAWTLAFSHGLKTLFGPADLVPFWSKLDG
jgi:uncharacterized protein